MKVSRPNGRIPVRAISSASLSLLSLGAYALLVRSGKQAGPGPALLLAAWLGAAVAGVLLFLWSRREEPGWPAEFAGLLAIATGITLVAWL